MAQLTESMRGRIASIKKRVVVDHYPICVERFRITQQVREECRNQPVILQRARILSACAERMPISINEGELIVGIPASRPMGIEIDPDYGVWSQKEIDSLKADGFLITPEDEAALQEMNEQFRPDTMIGRMGDIFYNTERIINMLKAGLILPEWKDKQVERGVGGGYAQSGLGLGPSLVLLCVEYDKFLRLGCDEIIRQAEEKRDTIRFTSQENTAKYYYYEAVAMSFRALNRLGERYAALAAEMAEAEADPVRSAELRRIAEICTQVPAKPARTFREAIQAYWFLLLVLSPSTTLPGGRFDQYMYPYYKRDIDAGKITPEEALELLCLLRLKDMELNRTSGSNLRKKNAGMAKWHNYTIGGTDPVTRADATNELTYLLIDAAMETRTPHHTLTLRVHAGTPDALMKKAVEAVRTGLGMPAFVSEDSYIATFTSRGVPDEYARDFVLTGCLDGNLPGKSRVVPIAMVTLPLIFDIFRHNGVDVKTGLRVGPETGDFTAFRNYEEMFAAFRKQADHLLGLIAEKNNVEMCISQQLLPDPVRSALMFEGIESGTELLYRQLPFENCCVMNPIGMVNLGDSFAAIRKLVFDEGKYTLQQLYDALEADWTGYEEMRRDFLAAPKYGNDDDYADLIVAELYRMFNEIVASKPNVFGTPQIPTGISITSHQPGGALTGATPDGRKAGEILADGTTSPMHGCDTCGPTAILKSAMKIDQDPMQATLLNMKFHTSALHSDADIMKLAAMIRLYLTHGGKHVPFNVVDQETLRAAQADPVGCRDLIVRVAGYSTYFVTLTEAMQNEIIERSSLGL